MFVPIDPSPRRAAVPATSETQAESLSLAFLPLLSLIVLFLIVIFFAVRIFKRSLHLPNLAWIRGKGQGVKGRLGLSGVELLPTSLKSIPTPNPSPFAASFHMESNAGKDVVLSRSSSLDGFPSSDRLDSLGSPLRSRARTPFSIPNLFKPTRKPLHRRSKSLGVLHRNLHIPSSSTTGSSAPSTPSHPLLIDFSTSSSSESTSSDVGAQKVSPTSAPLIPGIPIPAPSPPARSSSTKPHFPASTSVWTFDIEDNLHDSLEGTNPLLAAFRRTQSVKSQPLIQYDQPSSPPMPNTPALAPKRIGTANPFANLASSLESSAFISQRALSPSPLSLSPSSPGGIELVNLKHSGPAPNIVGYPSTNLVDFSDDEHLNVTDSSPIHKTMITVPALDIIPMSPSTAESADSVHATGPGDVITQHGILSDPFDDIHGISLVQDTWSSPSEPSFSDIEVSPLVSSSVLVSSPPSPAVVSQVIDSSVALPEEPATSAVGWHWDDAWSPAPLPVPPPASSWPVDAVSQVEVDDEPKETEKEDDLILFEREAESDAERQAEVEAEPEPQPEVAIVLEAELNESTGPEVDVDVDLEADIDHELDSTDAWFIEEPTAVWESAWTGDESKDQFLPSGELEREDDLPHVGLQPDVQIRFLDGLLAGPSTPVDIHVLDKQEDLDLIAEDVSQNEQEDELDDHNDIHDIHETQDIPAITSIITTISLLSTPTSPTTPLPTLPLPSILTDAASLEEHPDPELLPLPELPLSALPMSPIPVSPQPLKPLSPTWTLPPSSALPPAQTPTPPASPPPTHNVPARPLWSLRAADAPPLGLPAAAVAPPSPAPRVLAPVLPESEPVPVVEVIENEEVEVEAVAVVDSDTLASEETVEDVEAPVVVVSPPEEAEDAHEDEETAESSPTDEVALSSLPGSFPSSPSPLALSLPVSPAAHVSLTPPTSQSPSTEAPPTSSTSRAVQPHNHAGSNSNRLRTPRSALDLALAMQLRPGLGAGADPAWMVRFLMALFGWVAVLVSGDI
ncbi:hypothetical protein H0H81_008530 [Sphagnurus paluster]|uniref:Uncharacterized protein n=1 Tax=Sphagnurus paluster TaxID=117069 RepID=A0A9P7GQV7_9AGAR|nr:hypothetical protein H0H81_008530 [Sphagnurus paluster]